MNVFYWMAGRHRSAAAERVEYVTIEFRKKCIKFKKSCIIIIDSINEKSKIYKAYLT